MDISYVAINRIAEIEAKKNPKYRKMIERNPKQFLSDGERLSDEELTRKLANMGFTMDRGRLSHLADNYPSAQALAKWMLNNGEVKLKRSDEDWLWICLCVLWKRWLPGKFSFEMIDDMIQEGYEYLEQGETTKGCDIWDKAWNAVLRIMDENGITTIKEFDSKFRGTQSVFNWHQDYKMELWNAGLDDDKYLKNRIGYFEEYLSRFGDEDALTSQNARREMAETYFFLGDKRKADELFSSYLSKDPTWGWGWISWSDCYASLFSKKAPVDIKIAEQKLKEGLAVENVTERDTLLQRLATLYNDTGRESEARKIEREIEELIESQMNAESEIELSLNEILKTDTASSSIEDQAKAATSAPTRTRVKIGRNEPCPCGSGKKYKRCCLK